MKVLCIGDIMGRVGRDMVLSYLDRNSRGFDCIIANGENAAHGRGMSKPVYEELKRAGIHCFTMGNHVWGCPDIVNVLKYNTDVVRPANLSPQAPWKRKYCYYPGGRSDHRGNQSDRPHLYAAG